MSLPCYGFQGEQSVKPPVLLFLVLYDQIIETSIDTVENPLS